MATESEPRWLDDEEQDTWLSLIGVLMKLPAALDAQLQRDAGVTHFEYMTMATLSQAPERTLRMSALAASTESSLSRLSQVVSRLEKRNWVRRAPDPSDGRYTLATLTDDGWEKVRETAPGHVQAVRDYVFTPLTKAQIRQLTGIDNRILKAIRSDQARPEH
ncbi:MarR family winged helix-turn-helix transcriptional regulator [Nocardia vermiculata]|uniref:MarR family transcriptional regulator n=1 Tax=Nocardia vermiculata TaxID=257274 RepID=A0A846Y975_9NOCA|nr:MarR family transcriptional regulator [Nocardia vermiculata]NKY54281.1 MarR family transcriptional regulator [Nocardia vermiculata]